MRIKAQLLLGIAFGLSVSTVAYAQDAPDTGTAGAESDEIIVTGIRGSLSNSAAIKRDSNAIVDAISTSASFLTQTLLNPCSAFQV
jgi:hypothetical protein